jgi:NhaP-type Na+/H+ or K+/H+ antiporter
MIYYTVDKDGNILTQVEEFTLTFTEILLVCSILCSSDIIAAVTIIKFEDQPKLFSIILGEGLNNDAVAIILY